MCWTAKGWQSFAEVSSKLQDTSDKTQNTGRRHHPNQGLIVEQSRHHTSIDRRTGQFNRPTLHPNILCLNGGEAITALNRRFGPGVNQVQGGGRILGWGNHLGHHEHPQRPLPDICLEIATQITITKAQRGEAPTPNPEIGCPGQINRQIDSILLQSNAGLANARADRSSWKTFPKPTSIPFTRL